MLIGLNAQKLLDPDPAGPEKYTWHLFNALAKNDLTNKYVLYFPEEPSQQVYEQLANHNPNFSYKVISKTLSYTQIGLALELMKNPIDIFLTTVHTIPGIKRPSQNIISMVHGFEWKVNQQFSKKPLHKVIHPFVLWWTTKFSTAIVTPSETTKLQIKNNTNVYVIHEGVEDMFYKRDQDEISTVLTKYNIKQPYLFFLSTLQPRKNIIKTVEVFENLNRPELSLIVAGAKGWENKNIMEKIKMSKNTQYIGRVDDLERPALYSGAEAYVNFSLDEGFGLPLAEAMACGVKCVVSDIPAFREVGQNYPIFADPNDVNSMSAALKKERTQKVAPTYSWKDTAQKFIALFQALNY